MAARRERETKALCLFWEGRLESQGVEALSEVATYLARCYCHRECPATAFAHRSDEKLVSNSLLLVSVATLSFCSAARAEESYGVKSELKAG
jgi:hypothetical protein